MFGYDIGIDLGTATVLVYVKGQGIILREPSVVAINKDTNELMAVGEEARKMIGRTPGNIVAIRPLREGVISDYDSTEKMLKFFINKITKKKSFVKPRMAVCIPSGVTEVEKRAVRDAAKQAGARKVTTIEEPIAAAIGAGIDITRACGSMVVDIGGGTTDIAVISLGGNVVSASLKIAGDNFDEAIVKYMRKKY
ncbi:MAG: rod shape-determining protein MreB, partial [Clostridia bacterium]|nr:rod shape-determining protein MreB [Clostridia bacterium]